jgi:hypothetical protein
MTWASVFQRGVQWIILTACVCAVMLVTANNPSADDVLRPILGIIVGALGGAAGGKLLAKE